MKEKYVRGLETYINTLREFAFSKDLQQYGLNEKVEISYRTLLRTLHDMEGRGVLKIVRTEPSLKRGKDRNVWAITLKGLCDLLMGEDEESWEKIDIIAEVHEDKLLIFQKWSFFERENLRETIINNLERALQSLKGRIVLDSVLFSNSMKWTDELLRIYLDSTTLGLHILREFNKVKGEEWFKKYVVIYSICKKNPELSKYTNDMIALYDRDIKETSSSVKEAQQFLASL